MAAERVQLSPLFDFTVCAIISFVYMTPFWPMADGAKIVPRDFLHVYT